MIEINITKFVENSVKKKVFLKDFRAKNGQNCVYIFGAKIQIFFLFREKVAARFTRNIVNKIRHTLSIFQTLCLHLFLNAVWKWHWYHLKALLASYAYKSPHWSTTVTIHIRDVLLIGVTLGVAVGSKPRNWFTSDCSKIWLCFKKELIRTPIVVRIRFLWSMKQNHACLVTES